MTDPREPEALGKQLDILLKEYEVANDGYNGVVTQYRQQVHLLNIYIAVLSALVYLFLRSDMRDYVQTHGSPDFTYGTLLLLSMSVLSYLFFLGVDVIYNVYLCEGRAAAAERAINRRAGATLLTFFHKTLPYFNLEFSQSKGWVNPGYVLGSLNGMVLLALGVFHCILAFAVFGHDWLKVLFLVSTLATITLLLHQLLITTIVGNRHIYASSYPAEDRSQDVAEVSTIATLSLVPILTFVWGFVAFATSSVLTDSWAAGVDIPFLSVFTVSVGDALLLPVINYWLAQIVSDTVRRGVGARDEIRLWWWGGAAVAVGVISSALSHYVWTTDAYTDFISVRPGEMTVGGWWHFGFSIVQTAALVMLIPFWTLAVDAEDYPVQRQARRTWWLILVFCTLMLANFAYQMSFVFPPMSSVDIVGLGKFTLIPLLAALGALSYVEFRVRRHRRGPATPS